MFFVRIMACLARLFEEKASYTILLAPASALVTLVKVFVPIPFFVKTITDIALKLTTLFHHHYLHQQTKVHNSVKVFKRLMAFFFILRILVKFFVPIYFFSKPLHILL